MSARGQRGGRPFVLDRGVRRAIFIKKKIITHDLHMDWPSCYNVSNLQSCALSLFLQFSATKMAEKLQKYQKIRGWVSLRVNMTYSKKYSQGVLTNCLSLCVSVTPTSKHTQKSKNSTIWLNTDSFPAKC